MRPTVRLERVLWTSGMLCSRLIVRRFEIAEWISRCRPSPLGRIVRSMGISCSMCCRMWLLTLYFLGLTRTPRRLWMIEGIIEDSLDRRKLRIVRTMSTGKRREADWWTWGLLTEESLDDCTLKQAWRSWRNLGMKISIRLSYIKRSFWRESLTVSPANRLCYCVISRWPLGLGSDWIKNSHEGLA
jgi:hypothetical protein